MTGGALATLARPRFLHLLRSLPRRHLSCDAKIDLLCRESIACAWETAGADRVRLLPFRLSSPPGGSPLQAFYRYL